MVKEYGLWVHGDFIVGIPGDTKESLDEMIKFAIDLDLNTAQIYSAQPLPGTPFYNQCNAQGWLVAKKWDEYDGNYFSPVSYPQFSKKEIEEILKKFKVEWEMAAVGKLVVRPWKIVDYIKGRGLKYTIKKIKTIIKQRRNNHIYVAGV